MLTKQPQLTLTRKRSLFTVTLELKSKHDTDLGDGSESYLSSCHSRDLRLIPSSVCLCEICGGQKGMERVFLQVLQYYIMSSILPALHTHI